MQRYTATQPYGHSFGDDSFADDLSEPPVDITQPQLDVTPLSAKKSVNRLQIPFRSAPQLSDCGKFGTISKDNTRGESARRAEILAYFGAKLESRPFQVRTPNTSTKFPDDDSQIRHTDSAFIKGQEVVFKAGDGETSEWMLGSVTQVLGEGKSRRYKVMEEDPDIPREQRPEYRLSVKSMIPLPPVGAELPNLEHGKMVLAMYPDSTTMYKAEVVSIDMKSGKVCVRFEGDEEEGVALTHLIDRRHVVDYRS